MTTFNRLYRAPKFHLCIHTGNEDHIDFEPAEYRKTQYTFVSYGLVMRNYLILENLLTVLW